MKKSEVIKKARLLGLKVDPKMQKIEIIWMIQKREGNFPCFGTATDYCDQKNCWFRKECLVGNCGG